MKRFLTIFLLIPTALGVLLMNNGVFAQNFFGTADTVIVGNNSTQRALSTSLAAPVQSINITGNVKALIISVGFPDKAATLQFTTLVNSRISPFWVSIQMGLCSLI